MPQIAIELYLFKVVNSKKYVWIADFFLCAFAVHSSTTRWWVNPLKYWKIIIKYSSNIKTISYKGQSDIKTTYFGSLTFMYISVLKLVSLVQIHCISIISALDM